MQPTSNPLEQLADIHMPDGISWWPLAPGWWILLALIFMVAIGVYFWRRRRAHNSYRMVAQQQLDRIYADYQQTQQASAYLQALSLLLRRTALTAYPHSFKASINGTAWLNWLDEVCPTLTEHFSGELGQNLLSSAYQKNPQVDVNALHQLSTQWIAQHRNHRQKIRTVNTTLTEKEANHV